MIVQGLLDAFFQLGFITIALKIVRGENPDLSDLVSNLRPADVN
jgi:hypothetical protein